VALQLSLLVAAILLEVTANFAANAGTGSAMVRWMQRIAGPALIVLLVGLIVGNAVVFWLENPRNSRPRWGHGRSPYPGLSAFSEQDAAVFFGREAQVTDLVRRLHVMNAEAAERFVCITGASGCGKSSLVHAGVVPRLRGHRWHILPALTPAGEPLGRLASIVAVLGGDDRSVVLRELQSQPGGLARVLSRWRRRTGNRYGRVLIVLDQLEELATLSGPSERQLFLDRVAEALAADRRLWILATLRIEFLPNLLDTAHADLFRAPTALGALSRAELVAVIEEPARLAAMTFEPGLVSQIVEDAGTSDALPLLAYLLQELYLAAGPGLLATKQMYQVLGGVAGALSRQADAVFAELRYRDDPDTILSALLRLVAMDGSEPTRRRVPLRELTGEQRRILQVFTDARLLTSDAVDGDPYVQAAHEALFRQWAPLRQQVTTRAEALLRRTELERWASDWVTSGRSTDYLLTGERLVLAGQWLDAMASAAQDSVDGRALVEASRRRDTAFLRRVSESVGQYALANVDRLPELTILLTAAALTECPPTPLATRALMAALASSHLDTVLPGHTDAVRAVAWSPDRRHVATASRDGTIRIWHIDTSTVIHVLRGHTDMVEAVGWSSDATGLATAGRDATIRVWNIATGQQVIALNCEDFARGVAWSPDGALLAGTSRDRKVYLWDTTTWRPRASLLGHGDDVWGVTWAPDGTRLATASHDRTVIIWDSTTGQPTLTLRGHLEFVEAVAWSPDGQWIATGSGDCTARIWDAQTGQQHQTVSGLHDPVWSLAWTPDARQLILACGDGTARIWDLARCREVAGLRGHNHTVWAVAVSPDGQHILTGSADNTARIWSAHPRGAEQTLLAADRSPLTTLTVSHDGTIAVGTADGRIRRWNPDASPTGTEINYHTPVTALAYAPNTAVLTAALQGASIHILDTVGQDTALQDEVEYECLAVSPDGSRLAAGGKDNIIHLWDLRTSTSTSQLRGHSDWISALAWSPSGRYLASGSDDRTIRVWDMENPANTAVLTGHQNYVDGLSWAPDEHAIASCSADWTIRIWHPTTSAQIRVLTGHERRVRAVAWSPNGHLLATGSDDRTVRVWHAARDFHHDVIGVHRDTVTAVAWTPDSGHVITSSTDATVRIWSTTVDPTTLTRLARTRVFRPLTTEERRAYLLPLSE
jgi:WD40 repeat protein